jgi:beta-phosphoglucomutase-like phosphatase (HAD superfamily)
LVTSAERDEVELVLYSANILDCFEAAVFGGDFVRHKPAPDPHLAIAARMSTSTGFVFADPDAGMASAVAAGFRAIRAADPRKSARNRLQDHRN